MGRSLHVLTLVRQRGFLLAATCPEGPVYSLVKHCSRSSLIYPPAWGQAVQPPEFAFLQEPHDGFLKRVSEVLKEDCSGKPVSCPS